MSYYNSCAFPKPSDKKKVRKVNGYKNKKERVCYYCGKASAERHEIFAGPNRQISINCGFQIDLCSEHHKEIQDNVTQWSKEENLYHKRFFQSKYMLDLMEEDGISEEQALRCWMQLIGKNYLEDCDPE